MRRLNRKQKALLREWFEKNKATFAFTAQDLPYDLYHQLEQLNDSEVLNQEIEMFVRDLVSEDIDNVDKQLTRGRIE
jgi:hypothetical protein